MQDDVQIYARLTALTNMMENLWATVLKLDGATPADARATRDEMLRQFEDLPARNAAELAPSEELYLIRQQAVSDMEGMWKAIEGRLAQP